MQIRPKLDHLSIQFTPTGPGMNVAVLSLSYCVIQLPASTIRHLRAGRVRPRLSGRKAAPCTGADPSMAFQTQSPIVFSNTNTDSNLVLEVALNDGLYCERQQDIVY